MAMNAVRRARARPVLLAMSIAVPIAFIAPALALAAGGDPPSQPPRSCPKGKIWSGGKCVPGRSGAVPDAELVEQGRQLAVTGSYAKAIEVLELVAHKDDPLVLTYLGFSHRKLGDVETGMALYGQALAIDPDSVVTREYLGEGYVATGRMDLARRELAEIEARCGTACEAYRDLAEAIADKKAE